MREFSRPAMHAEIFLPDQPMFPSHPGVSRDGWLSTFSSVYSDSDGRARASCVWTTVDAYLAFSNALACIARA